MNWLGDYPRKVKCRECGTEFEAEHPARKYCGDNCKRLKYNRYHKDWQQINATKVKGYSQKSYDKKNADKKHRASRQVRIYDGGQN